MGDAALISSFLQWLEDEFDPRQVTLTSFTPEEDSAYFDYPFIDMVVRPRSTRQRLANFLVRRISWLQPVLTWSRRAALGIVVRYLRVWIRAYKWNARLASFGVPKHVLAVVETVASSDFVVTVPGGYLNALRPSNDWWMFHVPTFVLADALGKPLIFGPCSIGPFERSHEKWARRTLALADCIMVREAWSRDECLRLGSDPVAVIETPDLAFAFTSADRVACLPETVETALEVSGSSDTVGVSVREHNFPGYDDPAREQFKYLTVVADTVSKLHVENGARIVIVPQTMEDLDAAKVLTRILDARQVAYVNLTEALRPDQLRSLYSRFRLLVGTRMHANILAMSAGTPVAAIAYEPKTLGILATMRLTDWGLPIDAIDGKRLEALANRQWHDAERLGALARVRAQEQSDLLRKVWSRIPPALIGRE